MSDSDDDVPLSGRTRVAVEAPVKPSAELKTIQPTNGLPDQAGPAKPPPTQNQEPAIPKVQAVQPSEKPSAPSNGFSRDKLSGQARAARDMMACAAVPNGVAAGVNNIVPKPASGQPSNPTAKPKPDSTKPALAGSKPAVPPAKPSVQNGKPSGSLPVPQAKAPAVHSIPNKPNVPSTKPSGAKPVGQKVNGVVQKAQQKPAVPKPAQNKVVNGGQAKRPLSDDSDSEDDVPLTKRVKTVQAAAKPKTKSKPAKPTTKRKKESGDDKPSKKSKTEEKKAEKKWETLHHSGVLFPPDYAPHGVKMLYDGKPVDLTPEQEEVASMYGIMIETDYAKKKQFNDNFWAAFKEILGKGHVIKSLEKCDFRPMYEHFMAEREAKKALPKEEKVRLKEEKDAAEAKYKVALVDGRKEGVGNFRVEPPGLFRGRGEHPKMGQLKRRIYPRDITINIGNGQPIPEHPYKGQKWKEVKEEDSSTLERMLQIRHDNTVTWLAFWKDPISSKDFKYVWLAANSTFKSDSDLAKYEKARKLKDYVDGIRERYREDWKSKDTFKQQMGVALYFIDKLALRAGHEKDEDEADTVGCCTLKVENVEVMDEPANHIKFDFLGKDSIRYENQVEVDPIVWKLVKAFCGKSAKGKAKSGEDQVFETLNATDLNNSLKDLMDGLSVKVFRTYNASITLDNLLFKDSTSDTVDEKKADYDRANKEVAILCNHQRAVPKGHSDQMERLADKLKTQQDDLDQLTLELKVLQGKAPASKLKTPMKKSTTEEQVVNRIARKKEQLAKLQVQSRSKEDLKTVALGTSKINYLDPRITIAWCKRQEVPIEKIFNKSLLSKFHWAMDAAPGFRF